MNIQQAAESLFDQLKEKEWLVSVGVAYTERGRPTGIVVHVTKMGPARLVIQDRWRGYEVTIRKSGWLRAFMARVFRRSA